MQDEQYTTFQHDPRNTQPAGMYTAPQAQSPANKSHLILLKVVQVCFNYTLTRESRRQKTSQESKSILHRVR